jgi:hypothetical protein
VCNDRVSFSPCCTISFIWYRYIILQIMMAFERIVLFYAMNILCQSSALLRGMYGYFLSRGPSIFSPIQCIRCISAHKTVTLSRREIRKSVLKLFPANKGGRHVCVVFHLVASVIFVASQVGCISNPHWKRTRSLSEKSTVNFLVLSLFLQYLPSAFFFAVMFTK